MFKSAAGKAPAVLFLKRHHMRMMTDPAKLAAGKHWLSELQKPYCKHFRTYTDYVRTMAENGNFTYDELGVSELDLLELAIVHAGEAAKSGNIYDLARKYDLICLHQKVRGAHLPPPYAKPHLVVDNPEPVLAAEEDDKVAA